MYFLSINRYRELCAYYRDKIPSEIDTIISNWKLDKSNTIVSIRIHLNHILIDIFILIILYFIPNPLSIQIGTIILFIIFTMFMYSSLIETQRKNIVIVSGVWLETFFEKEKIIDSKEQIRSIVYIVAYITLRTHRECGFMFDNNFYGDIVIGREHSLSFDNYKFNGENVTLCHSHTFDSIFTDKTTSEASDSDLKCVENNIHANMIIVPSQKVVILHCRCHLPLKKNRTIFKI